VGATLRRTRSGQGSGPPHSITDNRSGQRRPAPIAGSQPVIPAGAARLFPPRRTMARRAAQWRDPSTLLLTAPSPSIVIPSNARDLLFSFLLPATSHSPLLLAGGAGRFTGTNWTAWRFMGLNGAAGLKPRLGHVHVIGGKSEPGQHKEEQRGGEKRSWGGKEKVQGNARHYRQPDGDHQRDPLQEAGALV